MSSKIVKTALDLMQFEEKNDRWGGVTYELAAWSAYHAMSSSEKEVLKQLLFDGPVEDGNIVSKSARNQLIDWGLATHCCYKNQQGYTVATYIVYTIFKIANEGRN